MKTQIENITAQYNNVIMKMIATNRIGLIKH